MANPTEAEMMADLATADAAGDTQLAQHIAGRIKAARASTPSVAAALGRGAAQGATFGFGDEISGAIQAVLPPPGGDPRGYFGGMADRYRTWRDAARAADKKAQEAHGIAYLAGNVVGAAPGAIATGGAGAGRGATLLARMASGARAAAPAGAVYGAGASEEEGLGGIAHDAVEGAAGAALLGGAAPAVGAGLRWVAGSVAQRLGRTAEAAAVRSTNADRTAARRAFKGSDAARQELGRFMLDEPGLNLRSPQAIREAAQGIQTAEGPRIGALAQTADASGAAVDLAGAVNAAKTNSAVSRLSRNTVTRTAYDQITGMLDDQLGQHGGKIKPSVAHDIRMQLDELASWDQAAPKQVQRAWRAARDALDEQLDAAMGKAGLADEWASTNARFSAARKLTNPKTRKGLADIGVERREGNRWGSPSEKGAALLGAGAAAFGNPLAGALIPAATAGLNRLGMPVAARTANLLSRGFGGLSRASLPPSATQAAAVGLDPELAALLNVLRGRPGLVPAAAEEDR